MKHFSVPQNTVRRSKPPAPPPPPPPTSRANDESPPPSYHSTSSTVVIDDNSPMMTRSLVDSQFSKSPSTASTDSLADYGMINDTAPNVDSCGGDSSRDEEIDRIPEMMMRRTTPARPPPPVVTRTVSSINSTTTVRPASYMHAVDNTNGTDVSNQQQPIRPPVAPRRSHMKTSSVDETTNTNRTILNIPDQTNERTTKPPLPTKPEVTKL